MSTVDGLFLRSAQAFPSFLKDCHTSNAWSIRHKRKIVIPSEARSAKSSVSHKNKAIKKHEIHSTRVLCTLGRYDSGWVLCTLGRYDNGRKTQAKAAEKPLFSIFYFRFYPFIFCPFPFVFSQCQKQPCPRACTRGQSYLYCLWNKIRGLQALRIR